MNTLTADEQDQRYDAGVWDDVILEWIEDPQQRYETDGQERLPIQPFDSEPRRVTITDVLVHGIGKALDRCTQANRLQVQRCLVHAGWKQKQERKGSKRGKRSYVDPNGTGGTGMEQV